MGTAFFVENQVVERHIVENRHNVEKHFVELIHCRRVSCNLQLGFRHRNVALTYLEYLSRQEVHLCNIFQQKTFNLL
jgi:hypothetical protein